MHTKRRIIFIVLILIISSYLIAIPKFNSESQKRAVVIEYDDNYISYLLQIENNKEINVYNFSKDFHDLLLRYDIVAYRNTRYENPDSKSMTYETYISENDTKYKKQVLTKKGELEISSSNYSSKPNNSERELSTILSERFFEIKNFRYIDTFGGAYSLQVQKDSVQNIDLFYEELISLYPEINANIQVFDLEIHQRNETFDSLIYIVVGFGSVLLLLINIISNSKLISAMKVEGYSNKKIYWKLYEKYFLLFGILGLFLILLISYMIFAESLMSFLVLLRLTLIEYVLFLAFTQVFSLLLLAIITIQPITSYLKGKSDAKKIYWLSLFVKFIACCFIIVVLSEHITNIRNGIKINKRYDIIKSQLVNLYSFGSQAESNYFDDLSSNENKMVKDHLVKENDLFYFSGGFVKDENESMLSVIFVDNNYLSNSEVNIDLMKEDEIYLIRSSDMKDKEITKTVIKTIETYEYQAPIEIEYDKCLVTYRIQNLLYESCIKDTPIIYYAKTQGYDLAGSLFRFDGKLDEVETYINNLFERNGFTPAYSIESRENQFEMIYKTFNQVVNKSLLLIAICILVYTILNIFIVDIEINTHLNKYKILKREGVSSYTLINYIRFIYSPLLMAVVLICFISKLNMNSIILILLLTSSEVLVLFYSKYAIKENGDL